MQADTGTEIVAIVVPGALLSGLPELPTFCLNLPAHRTDWNSGGRPALAFPSAAPRL
jgi:hypothetical protein